MVSAENGTWSKSWSFNGTFSNRLIVTANNGEVHVWPGSVNNARCAIHSDPAVLALWQLLGKKPPPCLKEPICFRDEAGELHRLDGPAVIYVDGSREYWVHGKLHREDGPAVTYLGGTEKWYWHGKRVSEPEHAQLRNSG